jgi:ATP/maltotriose-dependent transcriptional regulator MalT
MTSKRGETAPVFEIASGITLSRTLIPVLPPNFLTRKHLFPLLENPSPSTTVVLAPTGYGKTSLVAEWAQSKRDHVIWVTLAESDTLEEMSKIFIQATRNILPGFAPWFDEEPGIRPVKNVRRWGNDLLKTGKEFILVIDNLRQHTARDVEIATKLIQEFPPNLQFVTIRRDSIETIYATFSARGPLSVIGVNQLAFSKSEVQNLASLAGVDIEDMAICESLDAAHGWPSAVSMLVNQIAKDKQPIDFEKIVSAQAEPLRALATSVIETLDPELRKILIALSIVQEFTHEQAEVILGSEYSHDAINRIGLEGNYFSQTGDSFQIFSFSKLVREVLLVELRKDKFKKMRIHADLLKYHENRNEPNLALEHAYLAGDLERVSELFPDAARIMQATGNGRELIRWSIFAGDVSQSGLLKRATVELAGRLSSLEFRNVMGMIEQMNFDSRGTELEGFVRQITAGAKAYVDFSLGRFEEFDKNFATAMEPTSGPIMFGIEERVALFRLAAMRHFVFDETEKVEAIFAQAKELASKSKISQNHLMISSINAMVLFLTGDYRHAFEAAHLANSQFTRNGFVGIFGPLETNYVMARCQLEFAKPREAYELFSQIRELGEHWQQWVWHFLADGYLARDFAFRGLTIDALNNIQIARDRVNGFDYANELSSIIDLSEIFIRFTMQDNERLGILIDRAPKLRIVQQIKLAYDERMGKKSVGADVKSLPSRTAKEKIWKHLAETSEVIGQENLALKELRKALEVGALVGAKETFLRQSEAMGTLIMKIAGENPTVYLEDLASSVAERIKSQDNNQSGLASLLTKRELEILRHLSTDRPISAIATTLYISHNTMKTHLKNLYRKLEVDGRVTAVEKAKANFILR